MANSIMLIRCKHCGEEFYLASGYYGSYHCRCDTNHKINFVDGLNEFFGKHDMGMCTEEDWCSSDDARDHYEIAEFYE